MKIAIVAPTSIPARRANTIQVMKMAAAMVVLGHEVRMAAPVENLAKVLASSHSDAVAQPSQDLMHLYGLQHSFPIEWLRSSPRLHRYDYGWRAVRWARN